MIQILESLFGKLISRKLWVTLLTMLAALMGGSAFNGGADSNVTALATTIVGSLYVLIQGWVDRTTVKVAATTSPEVQEQLKRLETLAKQFTLEAAKQMQAKLEPQSPISNVVTGAAGAALALLLCVGIGFGATGCTHTERPACSAATLAQLQSTYVTELIEACNGKTLEECDKVDAIDNRHQKRVQEWVECQ